MDEFLKSIPSSVVTGGVTAAIVWYLLTKALPKKDEQLNKMMELMLAAIQRKDDLAVAAQDKYDASLRLIAAEFKTLVEAMRTEIKLLHNHNHNHGGKVPG